jgi:TM2 domain-containing membrane protein YozV
MQPQGMPAQGMPAQGMPQQGMPQQGMPMNSDKDWMTTLLLAILVGGLGVDRFYAGSIGLGILKLFTLGGCGLWALIDIIMIVTESYKDGNGLVIKKQ